MPGLPPDVLLLVASQVDDLQTLSSLSQTSSLTNSLLKTYEHSIVKTMVDRRLAAGLVLPPCGSILTQDREFLPPFSYRVIQELDTRSRRIEALFSPGAPLLKAIHESQSHVSLPDQELANLVVGLKRAAMLADRLRDCLAEVVHQSPPLSQRDVDAYLDDNKRRVKLAQFKVVHADCSPIELAFLSTLGDIAGMAYSAEHPFIRLDPSPWPRVTAFKEAVYSHGSVALWAWLQPRDDGAADADASDSLDKVDEAGRESSSSVDSEDAKAELRGVTEKTVSGVMEEIGLWEEGMGAYDDDEFADEELVLPGVYSRIRTEYSRRTGRPQERVGVEMDVAVLLAIREGVDEEAASG
ncbi:hypothetical protein QBC39DRAFT_373416 [Podospora conica]|nr:hypothetical protein QBC39DRAFT_373416 [Schizothecium conicum]